ncbi:MAG: GHKL domain-containing protein [Lachnospiraceae bacterium]
MFDLFTKFMLVALSSFVSIYLVYDFMGRVFDKKSKKTTIYYLSFIGIWILFIISNLFSIPIVSIGLTVFIPFIVWYFFYEEKTKTDIFIIVLFIIFLPLSEIISEMVKMLIFSDDFSIAPGHIIEDMIIFLIYRCIMFLLEKKIKPFARSKQEATVIIVPIISLYIITTITFLISKNENRIILFMAIWGCILIFAMNIFVYRLFDRISELCHKEEQYLMKEQQAQMQYKYYNDLEKKYVNSKRLFHDLKRHIYLIEQLYKSEGKSDKATEYTDSLMEKIEAASFKFHTNSQVLNILVNDKLVLSELNGIHFIYNCEDIDWSFMLDIDLATIVSNLLDNAFDACEVEKNKEIELCICSINNFVILNVTNNCTTLLQHQNGKYRSTKEGHMGIGLSNVKSIVEKYGGSLRLHTKDQKFVVQVTFAGVLK